MVHAMDAYGELFLVHEDEIKELLKPLDWQLSRPVFSLDWSQQSSQFPQPSTSSSERDGFKEGRRKWTKGSTSPWERDEIILEQKQQLLRSFLSVMQTGSPNDDVCGRFSKGSADYFLNESFDPHVRAAASPMLSLCSRLFCLRSFTARIRRTNSSCTLQALSAALERTLRDVDKFVINRQTMLQKGNLNFADLSVMVDDLGLQLANLADMTTEIERQRLDGAALINLLHDKAQRSSLTGKARHHLHFVLQMTCSAYLDMLSLWMSEGTVVDHHNEFFIRETQQEEKVDAFVSWSRRFSLCPPCPFFLQGLEEGVLRTGQYLKALRACGDTAKAPFSVDFFVSSFGAESRMAEAVSEAHDFASNRLLQLILGKFDLLGRLASVKHYFFLDKVDFISEFMAIAGEELDKPVRGREEIVTAKLQALLEISLRTSVCSSDPYGDSLQCRLKEEGGQVVAAAAAEEEEQEKGHGSLISSEGVTGWDVFGLYYKVDWPISLVLSHDALCSKYGAIFSSLFRFQRTQAQLTSSWHALQAPRCVSVSSPALSRALRLSHRLLLFTNIFIFFITHEVIERNWRQLESKLRSSRSIDEVIALHNSFLDSTVQQALVNNTAVSKLLLSIYRVACRLSLLSRSALAHVLDCHLVARPSFVAAQPKRPSQEQRQVAAAASRRSEMIDRKRGLAAAAASDLVLLQSIRDLESQFWEVFNALMKRLHEAAKSEPIVTSLMQRLHDCSQNAGMEGSFKSWGGVK